LLGFHQIIKRKLLGNSLFRGSPEIEITETKKTSAIGKRDNKLATERDKSRTTFIQKIAENSDLP